MTTVAFSRPERATRGISPARAAAATACGACPHRGRGTERADDHGRRGRSPAAGAGRLPNESGGPADHELGAAARYEDAGVYGYPQAAELRPAEDVLEGVAGGTPVHHSVQVGR